MDKLKELMIKYAPWWIMGLTFLLFAGTFGYAPLMGFDDSAYIFANPNMGLEWEQIKKVAGPVMGLWTPLPMLTYLIDYAIGGFSVYSYHIQNTLWHLLAVMMVWRLLRELDTEPLTAIVLTLIFAIHPQRVESVVWMAERKDVVTATFFFASLAVFVHFRKKGRKSDPWSWLLAAAAMFSKPTGVALPAVMFLLEVYRTRKWNFKILLQLWPYYLAAAGYMYVSRFVAPHSAGQYESSLGNPVSALLLTMRNYLLYMGKTFAPLELNPNYPYFVETPSAITLILLICLSILGGLVWLGFRKREILLYDILPLLLIFGGILIPVCGFFPFSSADFADRYSYLPSVFLLLAAAGLLKYLKVPLRGLLPAALAGFYIFYLGALNFFHQQVWQDDYTFYEAVCDVPNPNYRSAFILANMKLEHGLVDEAFALVKKATPGTFRRDQQLKGMEIYTRYIYGMAAYQRGDYDTAVPQLFSLAREGYDTFLFHIGNNIPLKIYLALADVSLKNGETEKAAFWYGHIAKVYPTHLYRCLFYGARADMLRGNHASAIKKFQTLLEMAPGDPDTLEQLKKLQEQ